MNPKVQTALKMVEESDARMNGYTPAQRTELEVQARVAAGGARARYTQAEQVEMIKQDLLTDAECAEGQAETGPFYPERGITRERLLEYAAECRAKIRLPLTPAQFIYNKMDS